MNAFKPSQMLAAGLVGIALVATGCSEKESGIGSGQKPQTTAAKTKPKTAAPAAAPSGAVAAATGVPKIVSPKGAAPTKLETRDLKVGKGAVAKSGSQAQINYVGALYGSGKQFDSSFTTGQPLPVQLGSGGVIPGFDQGITGMRVGGRRQVIIPPALGYGAQGQPPTIPANSTLIFVMDLVAVQ